MTFSEFLEKKAAELKHPQQARERAEWQESVDRLMSQILSWLHDSDPKRILHVHDQTFEVHEPRLGIYPARGLVIRLGGDRSQYGRSA